MTTQSIPRVHHTQGEAKGRVGHVIIIIDEISTNCSGGGMTQSGDILIPNDPSPNPARRVHLMIIVDGICGSGIQIPMPLRRDISSVGLPGHDPVAQTHARIHGAITRA